MLFALPFSGCCYCCCCCRCRCMSVCACLAVCACVRVCFFLPAVHTAPPPRSSPVRQMQFYLTFVHKHISAVEQIQKKMCSDYVSVNATRTNFFPHLHACLAACSPRVCVTSCRMRSGGVSSSWRRFVSGRQRSGRSRRRRGGGGRRREPSERPRRRSVCLSLKPLEF